MQRFASDVGTPLFQWLQGFTVGADLLWLGVAFFTLLMAVLGLALFLLRRKFVKKKDKNYLELPWSWTSSAAMLYNWPTYDIVKLLEISCKSTHDKFVHRTREIVLDSKLITRSFEEQLPGCARSWVLLETCKTPDIPSRTQCRQAQGE